MIGWFKVSLNFVLPEMDGLMEADISNEEEPSFFIFFAGKHVRMCPRHKGRSDSYLRSASIGSNC